MSSNAIRSPGSTSGSSASGTMMSRVAAEPGEVGGLGDRRVGRLATRRASGCARRRRRRRRSPSCRSRPSAAAPARPALHVADRRQVDAGVGVEAAARLDLELDPARVDPRLGEPVAKRAGDRLGVLVDARARAAGPRRGSRRPSGRAASGSRRRCRARAGASRPRPRLSRRSSRRASRERAPDRGVAALAADVDHQPAQLELRRRDGRPGSASSSAVGMPGL